METSSAAITVQLYDAASAAPLGALVRTGGEAPVYAVVKDVVTASLDPARRPVALGQDEPDEDAVYRNNPQLTRLFRTDLKAAIVGYRDGDGIRHHLPPQPPRIHAFVYACMAEEVAAFTQRLDFLPLLFAEAGPRADEAVAALLRQAAPSHSDPDAFLLAAGRHLARILSRDLQRLNTLLRSLRP